MAHVDPAADGAGIDRMRDLNRELAQPRPFDSWPEVPDA
jgi:hypothetical protein